MASLDFASLSTDNNMENFDDPALLFSEYFVDEIETTQAKEEPMSSALLEIMSGVPPCNPEVEMNEDKILRIRSPHLKILSLWGCSILEVRVILQSYY